MISLLFGSLLPIVISATDVIVTTPTDTVWHKNNVLVIRSTDAYIVSGVDMTTIATFTITADGWLAIDGCETNARLVDETFILDTVPMHRNGQRNIMMEVTNLIQIDNENIRLEIYTKGL